MVNETNRIFNCKSVDEIKAAVAALVIYIEGLENVYRWVLCRHLTDTFAQWEQATKQTVKKHTHNVRIVPPEHAPVMLLPSCVPLGASPNEMINGLKKFTARCDEFTPPAYDAITPAEIGRVLAAAQREFGLIDIIAPNEPMKILRFNNSHIAYNSQCGFSADVERPPTIFLFHPNQNDIYDRVFIFAHELGHALHFALTHDLGVLPDGFDHFNESMHIKFNTLEERQEAFADAVALAILAAKGLRTHFPTQFSRDMSPCFTRYIRGIIP